MSISGATAVELLARMERGDLSSAEITGAFLDRIQSHDEQIGAFLFVDRDAALGQAEQVDARRKAGRRVGKLAGLPVAVKDVLCVKGQPTTCASRMLRSFMPP